MAGSKKREGSVPLVDEVGDPQETLKELTFEWNPEIWEKGGEALLGAVGLRPEGWQMTVSTGNYMQSHETGTQLSERSEGAEVREMSEVLKVLE